MNVTSKSGHTIHARAACETCGGAGERVLPGASALDTVTMLYRCSNCDGTGHLESPLCGAPLVTAIPTRYPVNCETCKEMSR